MLPLQLRGRRASPAADRAYDRRRRCCSDNFHNFRNVKSAPVLQFFSNFANGASNELFLGYNKWFNRRDPLSCFPQIRVNTWRASTATSAILAGADQFSQGNQLDTRT